MKQIPESLEVAGSSSNQSEQLNNANNTLPQETTPTSHVVEVPLSKEEQDAIKQKMATDGVKKEVLSEVFSSLRLTVVITAALVCLGTYYPPEGDLSLVRFWIRTTLQAQAGLVSTYMKHTLGKRNGLKK